MRWEAENLHTAVAITIEERGTGSRFTLTQSGFLGPQGTMRRRVLRSTYTLLFEGPLSATVAKIAASPSSGSSDDVSATTAFRCNDGGPFSRSPDSPARPAALPLG